MFDAIATERSFSEYVIKRVKTVREARAACKKHLNANRDLLRAHYRPVLSTLERNFGETESQVIEVAIDTLKRNKVILTSANIVLSVSEFLVSCLKENELAWADPDLVATAISKLNKLPTEKLQEIIDENA